MGMRFVDAYIGKGNNATGPREVFEALIDRPIPNTFTQLITIDRALIESRVDKYSGVLQGLKQLKRMNEIRFKFHDGVESETTAVSSADPFAGSPVKFEAWRFSGVGNPVEYDVRPNEANQWDAVQQLGDNVDDDGEEEEEEEEDSSEESVDRDTGAVVGEQERGVVLAFGASIVRSSFLDSLRHESRRFREQHRALGRASGGGDADDVESSVEAMLQLRGAMPLQEEDCPEVGEEEVTAASASVPKRRDLAACAVRLTERMLGDTGVASLDHRDGRVDQPEYLQARGVDLDKDGRLLKPGWAERPKKGTTLGVSDMSRYLEPIAEMFAGEGRDKQHPSWFLSQLKQDAQTKHRVDHPTEAEVRKVVGWCIAYKAKCKKFNDTRDEDTEEIVPDYVAFLVDNVSQVGNASGGPSSQLPPDQEAFIQQHAAKLTPKPCLLRAMQELEGAAESLSSEAAKKTFMKRVSNVRNKSLPIGRTRKRQQSGNNSTLPDVVFDFIEENAASCTARECLRLALEQLDSEANWLQSEENQAKFQKRVQNVRSSKNTDQSEGGASTKRRRR